MPSLPQLEKERARLQDLRIRLLVQIGQVDGALQTLFEVEKWPDGEEAEAPEAEQDPL